MLAFGPGFVCRLSELKVFSLICLAAELASERWRLLVITPRCLETEARAERETLLPKCQTQQGDGFAKDCSQSATEPVRSMWLLFTSPDYKQEPEITKNTHTQNQLFRSWLEAKKSHLLRITAGEHDDAFMSRWSVCKYELRKISK